MFYFDPILIDAMARERLSRRGQLINLDMNDYRMFASEREVICAVRVKSEMEFPEFLSQLRTELYNAQSAVDEPAELLVHLLAHPEADVTMNNYSALAGGDQARGTASPSPCKEPGALSKDQGW